MNMQEQVFQGSMALRAPHVCESHVRENHVRESRMREGRTRAGGGRRVSLQRMIRETLAAADAAESDLGERRHAEGRFPRDRFARMLSCATGSSAAGSYEADSERSNNEIAVRGHSCKSSAGLSIEPAEELGDEVHELHRGTTSGAGARCASARPQSRPEYAKESGTHADEAHASADLESLLRSSCDEKRWSSVRVPTGSAPDVSADFLNPALLAFSACDAALGGGLAAGALHEICGLFVENDEDSEPSVSRSVECGGDIPDEDPATARTQHQPGGSASRAAASGVHDRRAVNRGSIGRGSIGRGSINPSCINPCSTSPCSTNRWIIPFGAVLHLVRQAMRAPELRGRPVLWVGEAVHPDPLALRQSTGVACSAEDGSQHASRSAVLVRHERNAPIGARWGSPDVAGDSNSIDASLLARSVFVRDMPDRGGSSRKGQSNPASIRAWSAEQAIRMGAAAVVVLNGHGLDVRWWRRLQLAASVAERPCVVLVVTPPAPDGSWPREARPAATRWSIHAAIDAEAIGRSDVALRARDGSAINDRHREVITRDEGHGRSSASFQKRGRDSFGEIAWTMVLRSIRAGGMASALGQPGNARIGVREDRSAQASTWAALESGALRVSVRHPRTMVGHSAWAQLAASVAARPRMAAALSEAPLPLAAPEALPLDPAAALRHVQEEALHVA